ncbi:MAG TPA: hypothetical protein VK076_07860 [Candidatus Sphingobacterium stercoripullorum]|nr:hypothetical protein [Candidatus Sphingobacterium stercoripullorum]
MNEFTLSLFHYEKERGAPSFSIGFPEASSLEESIELRRSGDSGKGWEKVDLTAIGIGRLFCYRQIRTSEPVTFITEPSEPVVCLRFHLEGKSHLGYLGKGNHLEQKTKSNYFFWQGEKQVEHKPAGGQHTLVELYVRPENLSHLANRKVVMDIIDQSLTQKCGPIDQYEFDVPDELINYMREMTVEIDETKVSVERFHHLFDSLILMCLGEQVDVGPRFDRQDEEQIAQEKASEEDLHYLPDPEVKNILDELEGASRLALSTQFYELMDKIEEHKQLIQEEKELEEKLHEVLIETSSIRNERLGKDQMKAAYLLADWYKKVSQKNKKILKKAIIGFCETSFELSAPSIEDITFFAKWSGKPYNSPPISGDLMSELLSIFLPPGAPELTPSDGTSRGNKLFLEQVTEAFGFKNMSDSNPEWEERKYIEVTELYEKLLFQFADTQTFGKDGEILRSDIIRELDIAYRENDFITLLQIEAENFGKDSGFLKEQSDEKLKWLVASLRIEKDNYQDIRQKLKQDPNYNNLEDFYRLGGSIDDFKQFVQDSIKESNQIDERFSLLIADITSFPTEKKIVALAKSALKASQEL